MKALKGVAIALVAAAMAVTISACGGSAAQSSASSAASDASSADSAAAGSNIVPLTKVSGAVVNFDANNTKASVDVVIAQGESLVTLSKFDENTSAEINATTYKDGEEYSVDSFYNGLGAGESGVDPGNYRVDIDAAGATGTMWVLAYPANSIDYEKMDAEGIINQVTSEIS